MSDLPTLRIDGEVSVPLSLDFDDLAAIAAEHQIVDVRELDANRQGHAVTLVSLLEKACVKESAVYLGLHGTLDDFHASIPLAPVKDRGILIYRLNDAPLDTKAGGPFRFFIPNYAACHTDEIDECANVKFVDHIELTRDKGFDNRPEDDQEHKKLHQR